MTAARSHLLSSLSAIVRHRCSQPPPSLPPFPPSNAVRSFSEWNKKTTKKRSTSSSTPRILSPSAPTRSSPSSTSSGSPAQCPHGLLPIESFCAIVFPLVYAAKTVASDAIDVFRELSKIATPPSPSPLFFPWRTPDPTPSLRLHPPPPGLCSSSSPPLTPSLHPPPLARSTAIASSPAAPNPTSSSSTPMPSPPLFDSMTSPPLRPSSPPSPLLPAHRHRPYTMTPSSATPSLPRAPCLSALWLSRSPSPSWPFAALLAASHLNSSSSLLASSPPSCRPSSR